MQRDLDHGFAGSPRRAESARRTRPVRHRLDDAIGPRRLVGRRDPAATGSGATRCWPTSPTRRRIASARMRWSERCARRRTRTATSASMPPAVRYRTGDVENGELWAQSRALLVLLAHHELTGDRGQPRGRASRRRPHAAPVRRHRGRTSAAPARTDDRTGVTHGLCYVDALQALHECTGDERYRGSRRWLLADFDAGRCRFRTTTLPRRISTTRAEACAATPCTRSSICARSAFGSTGRRTRCGRPCASCASSATPSGAVIGDESLHGLPRPRAGYEYCTLTELVFGLGRAGAAALRIRRSATGWSGSPSTRRRAREPPTGSALAYLCSDTRTDATAAPCRQLLAADRQAWTLQALADARRRRVLLQPERHAPAAALRVVDVAAARADAPGLVALAYGPSELRHGRRRAAASRYDRRRTYPFEDDVRFTSRPRAPVRMSTLAAPAGLGHCGCALDGVRGVERTAGS